MEMVGKGKRQNQQRNDGQQGKGTARHPAPGPGVFQDKAGHGGGAGHPPHVGDIEPKNLRLKINGEISDNFSCQKRHRQQAIDDKPQRAR